MAKLTPHPDRAERLWTVLDNGFPKRFDSNLFDWIDSELTSIVGYINQRLNQLEALSFNPNAIKAYFSNITQRLDQLDKITQRLEQYGLTERNINDQDKTQFNANLKGINKELANQQRKNESTELRVTKSLDEFRQTINTKTLIPLTIPSNPFDLLTIEPILRQTIEPINNKITLLEQKLGSLASVNDNSSFKNEVVQEIIQRVSIQIESEMSKIVDKHTSKLVQISLEKQREFNAALEIAIKSHKKVFSDENRRQTTTRPPSSLPHPRQEPNFNDLQPNVFGGWFNQRTPDYGIP